MIKKPYFRFNNITKVLPTAYDDSLSYYEELSKLVCSVNQLIDYINEHDSEATENTLYDLIDVVSRGADPTGTEDNTALLQQLINENPGKALYFRHGTYVITQKLVMTEQTANQFVLDKNAEIVAKTAMDSIIQFVHLRDVGLEPNCFAGIHGGILNANNTAQHVLTIDNSSTLFTVQNCSICNSLQSAVYLPGTITTVSNVYFDMVKILTNGSHCLEINATDGVFNNVYCTSGANAIVNVKRGGNTFVNLLILSILNNGSYSEYGVLNTGNNYYSNLFVDNCKNGVRCDSESAFVSGLHTTFYDPANPGYAFVLNGGHYHTINSKLAPEQLDLTNAMQSPFNFNENSDFATERAKALNQFEPSNSRWSHGALGVFSNYNVTNGNNWTFLGGIYPANLAPFRLTMFITQKCWVDALYLPYYGTLYCLEPYSIHIPTNCHLGMFYNTDTAQYFFGFKQDGTTPDKLYVNITASNPVLSYVTYGLGPQSPNTIEFTEWKPAYQATVLISGDSILEANVNNGYGLNTLLGEKGYIVYNNAVGGAYMSDVSTNEKWIPLLLANICTEHPNADYVIYDGGYNDYVLNYPHGDAATAGSGSYYGLRRSASNTRYAAKNADIYYVFTHRILTSIIDINTAVQPWSMGEFYTTFLIRDKGIEFLSNNIISDTLYTDFVTSDSNMLKYTLSNDGIHPTLDGYRRFYLPAILKRIGQSGWRRDPWCDANL